MFSQTVFQIRYWYYGEKLGVNQLYYAYTLEFLCDHRKDGTRSPLPLSFAQSFQFLSKLPDQNELFHWFYNLLVMADKIRIIDLPEFQKTGCYLKHKTRVRFHVHIGEN